MDNEHLEEVRKTLIRDYTEVAFRGSEEIRKLVEKWSIIAGLKGQSIGTIEADSDNERWALYRIGAVLLIRQGLTYAELGATVPLSGAVITEHCLIQDWLDEGLRKRIRKR